MNGNSPVWSLNMVLLSRPSWPNSYTFMYISPFFSIAAMLGGSLSSPSVSNPDGRVLRTFCLAPLMCPSCVSSDSGKCFLTFLTFMSGHEL